MSRRLTIRRRLTWLWVPCVLLLAAWGRLQYQRSPERGLPYHDSFASGRAEEWTALGGTWKLVDGSIRNDSDERGAKLLAGSAYWQNYLIEADVMLLGLGGDAGLLLRSSDEERGVDSYSGYYTGLRLSDNSLVLGRAEHGWREVAVPLNPRRPPIQASRWYHLQIAAYGCQFAAAATLQPGAPPVRISLTDSNCLRAGRAGLRSYSSGGVWRNIVVRRASRDDLSAAIQESGPQPPFAEGPSPQIRSEQSRAELSLLPMLPHPQSISSLRVSTLTSPAPATIRGLVVLTSPALFVQDSTGGIEIKPDGEQPLKVGDEVVVTGLASAKDSSTMMSGARVRLLWERTPTPALSVTALQAATGAYDGSYIEVIGRLRGIVDGPNRTTMLKMDAGSQSFCAIMNRSQGDYIHKDLKLNSVLRLRGVSVLDSAYTANLVPFALLLRSSDDVQVLAGPPWWSAAHVASTLLGLIVLALFANHCYLRMKRWQAHAVLEERERLAFEMHDTLAQSFAGIGFQLEAIRNAMQPERKQFDLRRLHQQIDLASDLVRHSQEEARRSIAVLRPQQLGAGTLLDALTICVDRMIEGGTVSIATSSRGDLSSIPISITDTLYRIGQEALANAVRHGHATKISIFLSQEKDQVHLLIQDDGVGFAPASTPGSEQGGLGILGMRKRAAKISASLVICSAPGEGTSVSVNAALPRRPALIHVPALAWQHLKERTRYVTNKRIRHPHFDRG